MPMKGGKVKTGEFFAEIKIRCCHDYLYLV